VPRLTKLKVIEEKENTTERRVYGKVKRNRELSLDRDGWIPLRETKRPFKHWVCKTVQPAKKPLFKMHAGYYLSGSHVMTADMTVKDAEEVVENNPEVTGFYHDGVPTSDEISINFFGKGTQLWTTYSPLTTYTAYTVTWP